MKNPISIKNGVRFYCEKSEKAYRQDPYEHYHEMVRRQVIMQYYHLLTDHRYPYEPLVNYLRQQIDNSSSRIAEIGCGIGTVSNSISKLYPSAALVGLDYSYQMIRLAQDLYVHGKPYNVDLTDKGFQPITLQEGKAQNLQFGVARSEILPFEDENLDVLFSLFLIDRLKDPISFFAEAHRCLGPSGKIVIISPLNFNTPNNWSQFYPLDKTVKILKSLGFTIIDRKEQILIKEPLDIHNNHINWSCIALTAEKV